MHDVVVVGAGAAGIFAAWNAARNGARVLLLEKTNRIGTKILISGGGKCNVAHAGPLEDVIRAFRPNEARFIRPACYRLPNDEIIRMMTDRGLEVYTRPDGRVFPVHQTAKDVVEILRTYLIDEKVTVRLQTPITGINHQDNQILGVEIESGLIECRHVVLATGGCSYPKTGTTGDGWPWATELGHTIVPIRAALAPITLAHARFTPISGVAFRDVVLKSRQNGKEFDRWRGDLLFTHTGISGPDALGISRTVAERLEHGPVTLEVDLRPDQTFEEVQAEFRAWRKRSPQQQLSTRLSEVVPASVVPFAAEASGIEPTAKAHTLGKKEINRLVETVKAFPLGEVKEAVLPKGEVAAGGISLDEVDPKSLRSKLVSGLYLCGEVLDVAGPVGGYNLQAAFATGFVAGETAALDAIAAAQAAE